MDLLQIKYDQNGIIPSIIQDVDSGKVLMLGWMNAEALNKTLETGLITFWSRSRNKLWTKGETSGNYLKLQKLFIDCDQDALLFTVIPTGPTCHTGNISCFYTEVGSQMTNNGGKNEYIK